MEITAHISRNSVRLELTSSATHIIRRFLREVLTTYSFERVYEKGKKPKTIRVKDKEYFIEHHGVIIFPVGFEKLLREFLQEHNHHLKKIETEDPLPYKGVEFNIKKPWAPRPYQKKGLDKLVPLDVPIILLAMATGLGKTVTSLFMLPEFKTKTMLIMRPGYISQWKKSIASTVDLKEDELLHIVTGNDLRVVLSKPEDYAHVKIFIISNAIYRLYINEYLSDDEFSYDISPEDIFEKLQIGSLYIDELHQDFHFQIRLLSLSFVNRVVGLTATLITTLKPMQRIYEALIPLDRRYDLLEENPYIILINMFYELRNPKGLRDRNSKTGAYSHMGLESSIMKHGDSYMAMVYYAYRKIHKERADKGDKCIIYFTGVETIRSFMLFLKEQEPDLNILVFIAGVSKEETTEADVILTTYGKAGTALDIPGLISLVNTISLSSIGANVQLFGRLRPPGEGEKEKIAVQVLASNHQKQNLYHQDRLRFLKAKVKKIFRVMTTFKI